MEPNGLKTILESGGIVTQVPVNGLNGLND
jgi:hypothetical protein